MAAHAGRSVRGIRVRAAIPLTRAVALAACSAAVLVAAGCSGKSGSPGLVVEPGRAVFAADENGARPAPQDLAVRIADPAAALVGAGFVDQQPSWITLDLIRTGNGFNLRLTITTTALPAATYRVTARVGIGDANQQVLATRDVEITYTVSPALRAVASSGLSFTAVEGGAPTAAREVAVSGTGVAWTATQSEPWLVLSSASGTGPAAVQVRADPAGLAPGDHSGTITFQAAGLPSVTLTATLRVEAVALAVEPRLAFSGKMGALLAAQPLHLGLNDGGVTAWTATASEPWIVLDHAEGVTSDTVLVGVDPAAGQLVIGPHTGTITFTAARGERTLSATVEVSFALQPAAFTVEPGISLGARNGAPLPAQTLHLAVDSGAAVAWTATASDPWIVLDQAAGTATPATLGVTIDPSRWAAAVGVHTGTITLGGSVGGQPLSATVSVSVTLDAAAFTVPPRLAFSGKNGVELPAQALQVALDSGAAVDWTASASDPWIVLDRAAGTTPETLTVRVDPARGSLASGAYAGTVVLEGTLRGQALRATLPVSLALARPVLTVQPTSLVLGGALGRDLQPREVTLGIDIGTTVSWKAATGEGWLSPSATAGVVSSATPATVVVAPRIAGLTGGSRDGTLTFSVTVNGDVLTAALPVRLELDDHRLLASDTGVAFATTPTLSNLTRTLRIQDSLGRPTSWTAQASESWLSVTQAGVAGDELVLTAKPTDLAVNTVHTATVDVIPDDPDVAPDQIQVGLWVGAGDPPAAVSTGNATFSAVAVDPVRPYAYVHAGGSSVTVYNVFTAVPVATIAAVGAQLGSMTVAPDGRTLYAVDRTNFRIVPVDLATRTVGTSIPVGVAAAPSIHAVRTGGKLLLLGGNRCIYDAATGAVRYPAGGCTSTVSAAVSASLAGNIFSIGSTAYRLDYTALAGGTVVVGQPLYPGITAYNTGDYAFNPDGSRMYLAVLSPYDFYVVDTTVQGTRLPQVQQLPGAAYPNNVEVAKDGRVFAAIDGYADKAGHDAWVFSPDGFLLQSLNLSYYGAALGSLKVSGDGLRMVSIARPNYTGNPGALLFNTVAP